MLQKKVAVIVAHPDDETLWAGGTIIDHPEWDWHIFSLCRKRDPDRAPKYFKVLKALHAGGDIADMADGPEQTPLADNEVEQTILHLLPYQDFDLIITHGPQGEYTRHRRHEETSKAVDALWHAGKITAPELWMFAYEDGQRAYFPRPLPHADIYRPLSPETWQKKYGIMTELYGFPADGWEAQTTPKAEAFWKLTEANNTMHS